MHHKFDVKSFEKLDNLERRKTLPPDEILRKFGLSEGDILADIGCGTGYFSIPASVIVGLSGKVLAIDISDEMLGIVGEKAHQAGATNVETIKIDGQNLLLDDNSVDFETVFFVLHEAQDIHQFIFELSRILKPFGKLALIDWKKKKTPHGPPVALRIGKNEAVSLLAQAGFVVKSIDVGTDFYGLLASKPT